jgi:hypothetical protein
MLIQGRVRRGLPLKEKSRIKRRSSNQKEAPEEGIKDNPKGIQ